MQKGPEIFTALSSHVRFGSRQVDDPAAIGQVHDKVLLQTAVPFVVIQTTERLNRNDQVRQFNAYLFCFKCFSVYIFAKARNQLSILFDA
jgi:hypothetical protein